MSALSTHWVIASYRSCRSMQCHAFSRHYSSGPKKVQSSTRPWSGRDRRMASAGSASLYRGPGGGAPSGGPGAETPVGVKAAKPPLKPTRFLCFKL